MITRRLLLHEECFIALGMTTTGCARYRQIIQEIRPKIVIVEEAAEVLEAHIITTLSPGCEHLIMIGDHQQLRPKPAVWKLAKKFNLDVSMFERMIRNKLPFECLQKQHRMRPEISQCIRFLYPNVCDAASVTKYDSILGMRHNMFYVDHGHPEGRESELRSHFNQHEVEFIVQLCRYLLHQGYQPQQITILTPYFGQLLKFKEYIRGRHIGELKDVRLTVVDNYQGEENDIILLSLVRSNSEGSIGFLGVDNRVCVALSRAKKGFYVIGNFQLLRTKSDLWKNLEDHMKTRGQIGESMMLRCQNHPDMPGVTVRSGRDFDQVSEGGCNRMCNYRLACGHACPRQCHIYDRDHTLFRCRQKCGKLCSAGLHHCPKLCNAECGPCNYDVEKLLPGCGHRQNVKCGENVDLVRCQHPCDTVLSCGHRCVAGCSRPHTIVCEKPVKKLLPCKHSQFMKCHVSPEHGHCNDPCKATLKCDHPCSGDCTLCHRGQLHRSCVSACERVLVCGHICKEPCTKECPPCPMPCRNRCVHSKCQAKCGEKCVPCKEKCAWQCPHHRCSKLCGQPCDRLRCNEPCQLPVPGRMKGKLRQKSCGHPCVGLCGEPCPKLCRVCDKAVLEEIFFGDEDEPDTRFVELSDCGHVISVENLDRWMDSYQENDGQTSVQLKKCPKCSKEIRQHLRYGNIIKQALADLEKVKQKIRGDPLDNMADINTIRNSVQRSRLPEPNFIPRLLPIAVRTAVNEPLKPKMEGLLVHLQQFIHGQAPAYNARGYVAAMRIKAQMLESMTALMNEMKKRMETFGLQPDSMIATPDGQIRVHAMVIKQLNDLAYYLHYTEDKNERRLFAEGQIEEMEWYVTRVKQLATYFILCGALMKRSAEDKGKLADTVRCCWIQLTRSSPRYNDEAYQQVRVYLKLIEKTVNATGLGISNEEKLEIIRAVGLSKGHWFKCPKG